MASYLQSPSGKSTTSVSLGASFSNLLIGRRHRHQKFGQRSALQFDTTSGKVLQQESTKTTTPGLIISNSASSEEDIVLFHDDEEDVFEVESHPSTTDQSRSTPTTHQKQQSQSSGSKTWPKSTIRKKRRDSEQQDETKSAEEQRPTTVTFDMEPHDWVFDADGSVAATESIGNSLYSSDDHTHGSNSSPLVDKDVLKLIHRLVNTDLNIQQQHMDKRTVYMALWELADLCIDANNGNTRRQIFQSGGHVATIQIMKRFMDNASIQIEACRVLLNLSYRQPKIQQTIVELGGLVMILTAMLIHKDHDIVQLHGVSALVNLIANHRENSVLLSQEVSGLETIARNMMQADSNLPVLQRSGCRAFWNLCQWVECKQRVLNSGGVVAVSEALQNYPNQSDVQKYGRKALERWLGYHNHDRSKNNNKRSSKKSADSTDPFE